MRGNLVSGIAGGVCVAVLMGLFGAGRTDTVVARQLVLVDDNGNKVGQIGSDETGEPFLQFRDSNGNVRLLFGLLKEADGVTRTTALKLMNHDGSAVTVLDPKTQQSISHYSRTRSRSQQGHIHLLGVRSSRIAGTADVVHKLGAQTSKNGDKAPYSTGRAVPLAFFGEGVATIPGCRGIRKNSEAK